MGKKERSRHNLVSAPAYPKISGEFGGGTREQDSALLFDSLLGDGNGHPKCNQQSMVRLLIIVLKPRLEAVITTLPTS